MKTHSFPAVVIIFSACVHFAKYKLPIVAAFLVVEPNRYTPAVVFYLNGVITKIGNGNNLSETFLASSIELDKISNTLWQHPSIPSEPNITPGACALCPSLERGYGNCHHMFFSHYHPIIFYIIFAAL